MSKKDLIEYKKKGYFDEHIITLQSLVFGQPFIYSDTYLLYWDPSNKSIWIDLFSLGKNEDRIKCLLNSISKFNPDSIMITSPEQIQFNLENYFCKGIYVDRDYQIELEKIDEKLRGRSYKDLRYNVNIANKQGYVFSIGKEITLSHIFLIASHMTRKIYYIWDYQTYLKIEEFVRKFPSAMVFNVFSNGQLIGFDIVDVLNDTLCTPYGFYLKNRYVADFLMYNELLYAKEHGFKWFDVGWGCNEGLEEFKKKWRAIPRFEIYLHEYSKV